MSEDEQLESLTETVLERLEDMAPALTMTRLEEDQYEVRIILSSPSPHNWTQRSLWNLARSEKK